MKVSVPNDFGNSSKKHILPLVPEPIKGVKKEDLATVNLCSDPAGHNSTQVKFSFKGLDGDHEMPREILGWHRNVKRALTGLNLMGAGPASHNMCKQFMRGSTLSSFESAAMAILVGKKANDIVHAEMARNKIPAATDPNHDAGIFAGLQGAATTAGAREAPDHLSKRYGPEVVGDLLNKVVKNLLPNKTLQRVKRHLRREARNLVDMSAKQHIMHICRINTEEIACCPPAFDQNQCSTDDEIIDILLWNTPKC